MVKHQDNKTHILLIILILLVGSVLIYLILGSKIRTVIVAEQTLNKGNPNGILVFAYTCRGINPLDPSNTSVGDEKECSELSLYFRNKAENEWKPLIKKYQGVNCNDFTYKTDAQYFYEYYGGGWINAMEKAVKSGYKAKADNIWGAFPELKPYSDDPFGLDADRDFWSCEQLPTKPRSVRDNVGKLTL